MNAVPGLAGDSAASNAAGNNAISSKEQNFIGEFPASTSVKSVCLMPLEREAGARGIQPAVGGPCSHSNILKCAVADLANLSRDLTNVAAIGAAAPAPDIDVRIPSGQLAHLGSEFHGVAIFECPGRWSGAAGRAAPTATPCA